MKAQAENFNRLLQDLRILLDRIINGEFISLLEPMEDRDQFFRKFFRNDFFGIGFPSANELAILIKTQFQFPPNIKEFFETKQPSWLFDNITLAKSAENRDKKLFNESSFVKLKKEIENSGVFKDDILVSPKPTTFMDLIQILLACKETKLPQLQR